MLASPLVPIVRNIGFFSFMYILGVVCMLCTMPENPGARFYNEWWLELLVDDYAACLFLSLIPGKVRPWLRGAAYSVLYVVAVADVYCYTKFGSTLNPSMLLLLGETDSREAGEFLRTYLTPEILKGKVGYVLLVVVCHVLWALRRSLFRMLPYRRRMLLAGRMRKWSSFLYKVSPVAGMAVVALLVVAVVATMGNKQLCARLMTAKSVGEIEHQLTAKERGEMYMPIYRLAFSLRSNQLAAGQLATLKEAARKARGDSCSFASPCIVLIIGESFGRHHSSQYGYAMKTTPRQERLEKRRQLIRFSDVVSPWNLTSFVFKNVFSMHVIGQKGEWCDYPLFPLLMRKAGYRVTFLTNQFLPRAKDAVYDFSGGFFLNDAELSGGMFDFRNDRLHTLDEALLDDYRRLQPKIGDHEFTIFHLLGQHVNYRQRYPSRQRHFWVSSYEELRPDLSGRQKRVLSDYDNATLYNDSVVDRIVSLYSKRDAVVIYMPDHGEECYEGNRGFICRNHSAAIDYDLARYEFEIPFWIYCSPLYARKHPDMVKAIRNAKDKRFMIDAIPHLLMHLAGISAPDYSSRYDILSDDYDEMRPRLLKGTTDYDELRMSN